MGGPGGRGGGGGVGGGGGAGGCAFFVGWGGGVGGGGGVPGLPVPIWSLAPGPLTTFVYPFYFPYIYLPYMFDISCLCFLILV